MKKIIVTFFVFAISYATIFAQKKQLILDAYDTWKRLSQVEISNDGKYAVCVAQAQDGDGFISVVNLKTFSKIDIPRGVQAQISCDSKFVVFKIKPFDKDVKNAKKEKKKDDKMPKDSVGILNFSTKNIEKIANIKTFKFPTKNSDFLSYTVEIPKDTSKNNKKKYIKSDMLIVKNFKTNKNDTIKYINSYEIPKSGNFISYIQKPDKKDSITKAGIYLLDIEKSEKIALEQGKGEYKPPCFDELGGQLMFYASKDTTDNEFKVFDLYYTRTNSINVIKIADTLSSEMQKKWAVNSFAKLRFSQDGKKMFFGVSPIIPPKDTTINESEQPKLDIWHYNDDYLQTVQLKNADREKKRSYLCVAETSTPKKFVMLENPDLESVYVADKGDSDIALGTTSKGYRKESQWLGYSKNDVYTVSVVTGEKTLVQKALDYNVRMSPKGKFIVWFNKKDAKWVLYSVETKKTHCLNENMNVNFFNEENSIPDYPAAYGFAGFNEDETAIFIYDKFDIWKFDTQMKNPPTNITKGFGRKNKLIFRIIETDDEKNYLPSGKLLLSAFNKENKESGYYLLNMKKNKYNPECLLMEKYLHGYGYFGNSVVKAKNAETYLFTKSNFNTSPDVWVTSNLWKSSRKITDINPQMKNYLFGTPELVGWKTFDGFNVEGILYKPENFDAAKQYPMIIYFYEKHSDDLYRYFMPAPSASTINIAEYCSNGYLVFTPDIHYTDGHPGRSAYNSIVSGTEMLCKYPWVNKSKIGIQGQSWGGYQVAYLITQTDIYAAAGAGAPVSNMTSAYGGIRWESGVTRQMQYEKRQSRIGKNLWEGLELYIENSPLFFAQKVKTPLLIMHNDNDGAVPWYQGIEYFTALRRLDKKVWMLQYDNEAHNLLKRCNRKDLSIRLKQFFDYYLKDAKMPEWMAKGVPATKKGIELGYEFD